MVVGFQDFRLKRVARANDNNNDVEGNEESTCFSCINAIISNMTVCYFDRESVKARRAFFVNRIASPPKKEMKGNPREREERKFDGL